MAKGNSEVREGGGKRLEMKERVPRGSCWFGGAAPSLASLEGHGQFSPYDSGLPAGEGAGRTWKGPGLHLPGETCSEGGAHALVGAGWGGPRRCWRKTSSLCGEGRQAVTSAQTDVSLCLRWAEKSQRVALCVSGMPGPLNVILVG